MPYPNPSDPELKERMDYLDRQAVAMKMAAAAAKQQEPVEELQPSSSAAVVADKAAVAGVAAGGTITGVKPGTTSAVSYGLSSSIAAAAPSVLPSFGKGGGHGDQSGNHGVDACTLRGVPQQPARPNHPFQPATAATAPTAAKISPFDYGIATAAAAGRATGGLFTTKQAAAAGPEAATAATKSSAEAAAPIAAATTLAGGSAAGACPAAATNVVTLSGRQYYEDLCFKEVNQCVGRVIRHKGDYAVVVLADSRWVVQQHSAAASGGKVAASLARQAEGAKGSTAPEIAAVLGGNGAVGQGLPGCVGKLPGWIQRSYAGGTGDFGEGFKRVAAFFRARASAG